MEDGTQLQGPDLLGSVMAQCEIHQIDRANLDGIIISNIVELQELDRFWVLTNQSRDRLRESLSFPVVLFLNSISLEKMVRLANDLHSWSTSKRFHVTLENHQQDLRDEIFGCDGKNGFFDRLMVNEKAVLALELPTTSSQRQEFVLAYESLKKSPNACVWEDELMFASVIISLIEGRIVLNRGDFKKAAEWFEKAEAEIRQLLTQKDVVEGDFELGWIKLYQGITALGQLDKSPWPTEKFGEIWGFFEEAKRLCSNGFSRSCLTSKQSLSDLNFIKLLALRQEALQAQ
ncbi:uncharacterized protein TRIADDRAFT_63069, partial [Trichoplax adhaerens]